MPDRCPSEFVPPGSPYSYQCRLPVETVHEIHTSPWEEHFDDRLDCSGVFNISWTDPS